MDSIYRSIYLASQILSSYEITKFRIEYFVAPWLDHLEISVQVLANQVFSAEQAW